MWVGPGASVLSPSGGEPCVWALGRPMNLPIELTPGCASGGSRRIPTRPEGGTRFRWTGLVVVRLVWRPVCQGHTCGGRCGGSRTADREVSVDLADILNALGSQDWELKSAVPLKDSDTLLLILSRETPSSVGAAQ